MSIVTHEIAARNILDYVDSSRLVQGTWHVARDGKEMACLLGAAACINSSEECPAELMPQWLARCTVTLFDGLASEDIIPVSRRYAQALGKWRVITPAAWDDVLVNWLVRVIDQAVETVPALAQAQPYWPAIAAAVEQVKTAIKAKDSAANAAAYAANAANAAAYAANAANAAVNAYAAAYAAANAYAAAYAAYAAANAANAAYAAANAYAAAYAAYAAYAAAYAAANAYAAAYAAANAYAYAAAAAYKSLFNALLDEIEVAISNAGSTI